MEAVINIVDAYRDDHGVEPISRVLEIAPSTYHAHAARRAKPETAWRALSALPRSVSRSEGLRSAQSLAATRA